MSEQVEKNSTKEIERWIEHIEGYVDASDNLYRHSIFMLNRMGFMSYVNPMEWSKMNELVSRVHYNNHYWLKDIAVSLEKELEQIKKNGRST